MSALPSPSKSPVPAMLQLRSATVANITALEIAAPFMSQIVLSPVAPLRHKISDLPSPSKSPVPSMLQLGAVTVANVALLEIVAPFMSQIAFSPVVLLRHRMSDLPSPLKSRTTRTARVRFETAADSAEVLPAALKAATAKL